MADQVSRAASRTGALCQALNKLDQRAGIAVAAVGLEVVQRAAADELDIPGMRPVGDGQRLAGAAQHHRTVSVPRLITSLFAALSGDGPGVMIKRVGLPRRDIDRLAGIGRLDRILLLSNSQAIATAA